MKTRTRFFLFSLIFIILSISVHANPQNDAYYNSALRSYVQKLVTQFNFNSIDRERFLVQQIRMINEEIKSRITGINKIRENYFERLQTRLNEIRALKKRLPPGGSSSLHVFINELEKKIQDTIDGGIIDFKRQRVIEDAVQLLHIAEEMVQMDPNARFEQNPRFASHFQKTKAEFIQSFGQSKAFRPSSSSSTRAHPTIFDVYKEWKQTELVKYEVRLTDIQIIKRKLLRNATMAEKERMFRRELRQAGEAFNFGFYDLAERSFAEIMHAYKNFGNLDDCLFYEGESDFLLGRYHAAQKAFEQFVVEYPNSPYVARVYARLVEMAYHFDDFNRVLVTYKQMQTVVPSSDENQDKAALMAEIAALRLGDFGRVAELAFKIHKDSPFYRESRFLMAEAYAGSNQFDESEKVFKSLIKEKGVDPQFRFTVLLKLGYLNYDQGKYYDALTYFDQIGGYYGNYDRVLIGYAWTYYKMELAKDKSEKRDFSTAKKYLEILLDNFYGSDYLLEARALLGYINQLEENPEAAISNYQYAFNAKEVKDLSDNFNRERDKLREMMSTAEQLKAKALEKNNKSAFYKADETGNKIRHPLIKLSYMDLSSTGAATGREVTKLKNQLQELDRLKSIAQKRGNKSAVKRIERLQLKIYRAVNSIKPEKESLLGYNYFNDQPLARKVSVLDNKNTKVRAIRQEAEKQRQGIAAQLVELDFKIKDAKARKNYRELVQLELTKEHLQDLAKKVDFLSTQAYSVRTEKTNIRLDHWADYGAFGMTDVRFALKNKKAQQIADFQNQIQAINDFLELRKKNIEHQIAQINDAITLMTRRVREQERIRKREELKRQFEETYFDTHDTELNYNQNQNTTEPPKINEESNQPKK